MNYTYKFDGGELECELEFEPGERGSRESGTGLQLEPDEPDNVYLLTAMLNDVDIAELLSSETVALIEAKALKEMDGVL